ncbi:uncharacterized protein C2orf80 homolog [Spea bombifrons]|uniref:uncharacterized protein C2orf80 homolog n=1 Tax=Spea bombifrons TaxID=233779 RepID=UPI00234AD4F2|nr:uncharacterized protein C2orf80 homolog [Spea bombifrons]
MERKRLKKEVEKLLSDYVGTTLREKEFDPKGRKESKSLDDVAHYDLAIGVALQWLNSSEELKKGSIKMPLNQQKYPGRMEREAMILSSFAGIIMNRLPVENVFEIYGSKHSQTQLRSSTRGHLTQAFNLSLHPFAMLTAPQAAEHAWKHCTRLSTGRNEHTSAKHHNPKTIQQEHQETISGREDTGSVTEGNQDHFKAEGSEDI